MSSGSLIEKLDAYFMRDDSEGLSSQTVADIFAIIRQHETAMGDMSKKPDNLNISGEHAQGLNTSDTLNREVELLTRKERTFAEKNPALSGIKYSSDALIEKILHLPCYFPEPGAPMAKPLIDRESVLSLLNEPREILGKLDCRDDFDKYITERGLTPTNDEWLAWQKAWGLAYLEGRRHAKRDAQILTEREAASEISVIDEKSIWEKAAKMASDEADSFCEHNPPINPDACLNLLSMKFLAIAKTLPKREMVELEKCAKAIAGAQWDEVDFDLTGYKDRDDYIFREWKMCTSHAKACLSAAGINLIEDGGSDEVEKRK